MTDSSDLTVSAIVRTYNRAYIIRDALKSILEQTYAPQEIIVVDDASTDDTEAAVRSVGDPRVRYLRHEVNRGPAAACNSGVDAAQCDLIAFLDSDDRWEPTYLERQVGFLKRNPQAGGVFTNTEIYDNGILGPTLANRLKVFSELIKPRPESEFLLSKRAFFLCLLQEIPVKPSAFVVRKKTVATVGRFNEAWRSGEDWEFVLRMAEVADFGFIRTPLVVQRVLVDSTLRLYCMEDSLNLLGLFLDKKSALRGDREAQVALRKAISWRCRVLGWSYREAGEKWLAARTYVRGFAHGGDWTMLGRAVASCLPVTLHKRIMMSLLNPALNGDLVISSDAKSKEKEKVCDLVK